MNIYSDGPTFRINCIVMYLSSSQVLSHSRWSLDCITIFQSPRKTRIICVTLKFLLAQTEYDWGLKRWAGAVEAAKHTEKEIVFTIKILSRQGKMYDILFWWIYRGIRYLKYQTNTLSSSFARSSKLKVIVAAVSKFSQSLNFSKFLLTWQLSFRLMEI